MTNTPNWPRCFRRCRTGLLKCRPHEKRLAKYELEDAKAIGRRLGLIAWQYDATDSAVAAGLRMVADAIDPPAMVEARYEIAETLGPSMLTPNEWEARLAARNKGPGQIEPTRPARGFPRANQYANCAGWPAALLP